MFTTIVVLGVVIILLGVFILKRCNEILLRMQWLQDRFISTSPSTGKSWILNLAHEVFSMQERLAPLYLLPLSEIADEIRLADVKVKKDFNRTLEAWEALELNELESFVATHPQDDQPFMPSDNLKTALRAWAVESYKAQIISDWTSAFQDVYLGLLNRKSSIRDAEEKLGRMSRFDLLHLSLDDEKSEIKERENRWRENWNAGQWKKRLEFLQEKRRTDEDFTHEMRKMNILEREGS